MKKAIALILACALMTSCTSGAANNNTPSAEDTEITSTLNTSQAHTVTDVDSEILISGAATSEEGIASESIVEAETSKSTDTFVTEVVDKIGEEVYDVVENDTAKTSKINFTVDTTSESYIRSLGFTSLADDNLMRYVEDTIYDDLVGQLDSDELFVENVEAVYISKEYLEELAYNSQENVYFGYKLSELDAQFQGTKYIFTLGEDGKTEVKPFEEYQDTSFEKTVRNVAIGTGVILICVTVSAVSGGLGAPAVSMIFAASAKTATTFAFSGAALGSISAGVITGYQTGDFDKAIKAAAVGGSEGFKWGAITGAVAGGAKEAVALKGATLNGLTMNEAAIIQKETKYPLDVIKQFKNIEQYNICKEAGLQSGMVNGKTALIRNIDLNFVDEATGMTNLERMQNGLAALDPTGKPYELHHIGQHADSTLAILTQEEHRLGDSYKIWHELGKESEIDRAVFNKIRESFWKNLAMLIS